MAKKYLSLDRLTEYDALLKAQMAESDESTLESAKGYADEKLATLTSGTTTVAKAEQATTATKAETADKATEATHATTADTATNATNASHAVSADTATNATNAANANHATTADSATNATNATKATQDASGNDITATYETKTDASAKLEEAKGYADSAAAQVKNDLLNGAGEAYDTLKELGDLITENKDALGALETVATGKADKEHQHIVADITDYVAPVQSDWNQNDETALDFVKNRPFYGVLEDTIILEETTIEPDENGWVETYLPLIPLEEIKVYTVTVDGEVYECVPFYDQENDEYIIETDLFYVSSYPSYDETCIGYYGDGTHTISISTKTGEVTKLDRMYLPNSVFVKPDWNENDYLADGFIKNRPFARYLEGGYYILEDFTFAGTEYNGSYTNTVLAQFVEGESYTVYFDGEMYEDVVFYNNILGSEDGFDGIFDKYPFTIYADYYTDVDYVNDVLSIYTETEGNHTLIIEGPAYYYRQLDDQYLPASIIADWNETNAKKKSYIKNKPFGEREDGSIITIDPKFLPDLEHTHSWNDLEDKPFGKATEKQYTTILEEAFTPSNGSYGFQSGEGILEEGKLYRITLDDEYTIEETAIVDGPVIAVWINENAAVIYSSEYGQIAFSGNPDIFSGIEYRIKIERVEDVEVIIPLETKYLPEHLQFGELSVETIIAQEAVRGRQTVHVDTPTFIIGQTYKVICNDITYDNVVCGDADGLPAIGSLDFSFTDYPFVIAINNGECTLIGESGATTYHITVIGMVNKTIPLDTKYLPEHLQFGESEFVGTITNETILYEGRTYTFYNYNDGTYGGTVDGCYNSPNLNDPNYFYKVIWDGAEYICAAFEGTMYGSTRMCIGSPYEEVLAGTSTYPFVMSSSHSGVMSVITNETKDSHAIDIYQLEGELIQPSGAIKPIETKYLPEHLRFGVTHEETVRIDSEEEWLSETTCNFQSVDGYYVSTIEGVNKGYFSANRFYRITWDGVEYYSWGNDDTDLNGDSCFHLGAPLADIVGGGYTSYPFTMHTDGVNITIYTNETDSYHTIQMDMCEGYYEPERVAKINPKFLPEMNFDMSEAVDEAKAYTDEVIGNITNGTTPVVNATNAVNAEKLGGQLPSYYAAASAIPTGALANKNTVSESDLDSALAEKVNAASEGNHSHLNKDVLDGITADKVSAWDAAEGNAKAYADGIKNDLLNGAGEAYDTLKELGDLIDDNKDALGALETVATGKADKEHKHTVEDIEGYTAGVQSDWNQNDPEALDYVKNRPFYSVDMEEVILLEETTLEQYEEFGYCESLVPLVPLEENKVYTIILDGESYECTAEYNPEDDEYIIETDLFWVISRPLFDNSYVGCEYIGNHTMSVLTKTGYIIKLDKEYLPDSVLAKPDWDQNDPNGDEFIKNRPFSRYLEYNPVLINFTFEGNEYSGEYASKVYNRFVDGQTYDVLFDGEMYEDVVFKDNCLGSSDGQNGVFDEYPFAICVNYYVDGNNVVDNFNIYTITEGTHTFYVDGFVYSYVQLDDQYLPASIIADWNETNFTKKSYIKNKPFGEREDGSIITIDPKFLPELGDTHIHSWNDLEDKPFGEVEASCNITNEIPLFVGETYYFDEQFGSYNTRISPPINPLDFENLDLFYRVIWDGVEYICKPFEAPQKEGWSPQVSIGSPYEEVIAGTSEIPFYIYKSASDELWIDTYDTSETHTVDIYACEGTYVEGGLKKIDPKYLPEMDFDTSSLETAITTNTSAISANTSSIQAHTTAIGNLQTAVAEFEEITAAEIEALFA